MKVASSIRRTSALICLGHAVIGCSGEGGPAVERVSSNQGASFAEWKETVRVRPGRDVYAVGDLVTPLGLVGDEEALRYYQAHVERPGALTIHNGQTGPGTPVNVSAFPPGSALHYCIDRTALEEVADYWGLPSGTDLYGYVDQAFGAAAAVWNAVLEVSIYHEQGRERSCTPRPNDTITWYVRPMSLGDSFEYLTFVLHPNHNMAYYDNREFLILDYLIQRPFPGSFRFDNDPDWENIFSMEGLLLRALANGLGFVNESNRGGVPGDDGQKYWPSACRVGADGEEHDLVVGGVFLSDADPFSVTTHPAAMKDLMENPDCAGWRAQDYALSYLDVMGAACQYRTDNILYYCSQHAQLEIQARYQPHCSPYPLYQDGPGDCGAASDPSGWQNADLAAEYHAAVLAALD